MDEVIYPIAKLIPLAVDEVICPIAKLIPLVVDEVTLLHPY